MFAGRYLELCWKFAGPCNPPGDILKTVNKFIVMTSNTQNLDKIRLKNSKNQSKKTSTVYKVM